ncbi:MAG: DNA mismatch repair protein MutS [Lachnospiraceae bacterium]|nr:DNA mismatch repair protein MutS [Lachnospiraceae bacterium]
MNSYKTLEFDIILEKLAEKALSEGAKEKCLKLRPSLAEEEALRFLDETTQTRSIIEQMGKPPLPVMPDLEKIIDYINIEAMLMPEQIEKVLSFLVSCRRMKEYLKSAEATECSIAWYGGNIDELRFLEEEIEKSISNGAVSNKASSKLDSIRRQIDITSDQMKEKLNEILRKNKSWFSESFVVIRNGHYTLPVKREYKNYVSGTVIEISNKGGTCFIEPSSMEKYQSKLSLLQIEEDSEVRRILYYITGIISDNIKAIQLNMETIETLDFLFAKGKLSISMNASSVNINTERKISIINGRHPLINEEEAVPLNFQIEGETKGVVITGPNTGGKTVALKTVGLLSLMAQSGLHVPADSQSSFAMNNIIMSDIGDGQSITENLSTFSSHMKKVISILKEINEESLVLIDELGSGTDPAEGMGIAIAVLDALCGKKCNFIVTTHYPEVKEYAEKTTGIVNARMAFDKNSLMPLYRLEIGLAGESCALYIAERLGMPSGILKRAYEEAYGKENSKEHDFKDKDCHEPENADIPKIIRKKEERFAEHLSLPSFTIGDSVFVYPEKEIGIVYALSDHKGNVGVQVKGQKKLINHKRIKLNIPASELYPEGYDFSIIFDTVENRKSRHILEKRHEEGRIIILEEGDKEI